ncbi:DUF4440 domain-containing protein [Cytobacillus solani]|uniref:DUF4440 domain-containing protein n=1 Tax=Cytobacillus solani TaxID=1637975 RepID=A0A0Q3SG70_9BACI|nr:DUF4440 domain-containing protein [Cytobacillus solani]KOP81365.1 hypothetical protein AMS60_01990 [Bacillus sp. FJAT-21945]KQL18356.1 hypothetical protein AN957_07065 [Cytobacillus solani]USK56210.1 DUF4440 domain-containing protein [Cytobacillus solani]
MVDKSSLKELLLELEEKLLKPEIRASKDELTNILSEDFFEFGSSGKVLYKNESIGEVNLSTVCMKLSDFEIHPLSEEIVLTTYRIYNELNKQHSLRSSIWKLIDGTWKMHFHQGTLTTPSH